MHYVLGDVHNEINKLNSVLEQIKLTENDELIFLGDLFDRGYDEADPVEVYFALCRIKSKLTWIRGNHDQWLADYIMEYFSLSERKQRKMAPYTYNSFELIRQRFTEVDMINLAERIHNLPLMVQKEIEGKRYLFAHAMTSRPDVVEKDDYYLMGNHLTDDLYLTGIDGYISIMGHVNTSNILCYEDRSLYLDEYMKSVWRNKQGNVYLMDCGSGFKSGRLACLCLETGERFYS